MRSSMKSESNGNNSDNINNNNFDADEDKRTADDAINVASSECSSKLISQAGNCESELTQRTEHVDNDKSAKINVYEQVKKKLKSSEIFFTIFFSDCTPKRKYC